MIDGLTKFNLIFAETDKCLILFNYKVGSRFVQSVFGNNMIEHHLTISINEGFLFDTPAHKEFLNKIKSPSYNKKIIILYRNPYEKILSGFIEDFQEVGLRPLHRNEYVEEQFLKHGGKYIVPNHRIYTPGGLLIPGRATCDCAACMIIRFDFLKWYIYQYSIECTHSKKICWIL